MSGVENYIADLTGNHKKLITYFHHVLTEEFNLGSKIRYRIPFYDHIKWICYLNPLKTGGIDFCFMRGIELSNSYELLQIKDRQQIMSIEIESIKDINLEHLYEHIQEAIILDETVPYKKKKRKK